MIRALLKFFRAERGGIAVIAACVAPVLCLCGAGAIDVASVYSDHAKMQDAADAAALYAARQLGVVGASGVPARAQSMAMSELQPITDRVSLTVNATVAADNSVTVQVTGHRDSFFANLMPPGGWNLEADATAKPAGAMPLCVLHSGSTALSLGDTAQMTATGCLVQSNGSIQVLSSALMQAGVAQAVGGASGRITPSALTGAPPITDPFASMNIAANQPCTPLDILFDIGVQILTPGLHCGNLTAKANSTVILLPGEHYFMKGKLQLSDSATLKGSNVALIFDSTSYIQFDDNSTVDLTGRTSGPYSGFVMATTTANTSTFEISSDSAHRLLGTLYMPSATLSVSGTGNSVADQSAWTVVIAKAINMSGSANLVINSAYAGNAVPVPDGVGPNTGVVLVK